MDLAELARSLAGPFNDDYNQFHSCYQCHGSPLGKVYVNTPWPAVCFDVDNEVVYLKQDLKISNKAWQSQSVNDPVFDTLTHYWSMDEASGTRVDSKGSKNLSESGGAVSSGTGIDGSASSWNGTGTANLTTASLGFGSSDIKSVAFWVKVNAFPASFYNFCIGEADPDPSLEIDSHDGGTTGVWVVATIVDGALDEVPATVGTWNLFVATFVDATTWKWSMNGGAFRTVGGQSSGLPSGTTLSVAGIVNGANQMNGLIDELMTFNVLLTQGDVTTLWNGGIGKFYRP